MGAESFSDNPRYALLNEQIFAARGEDLHIADRRASSGCRPTRTRSCPRPPARASSCTSRSTRRCSPTHWNAAQAIAGIQLAVGANSPFLFGRELWRETRIALFEQATDTRSEELKAQGVRPRVWFGERWITGIFDLFEENVRYFPALLPLVDDEDPEAMLERGDTPAAARAAAAQRDGLPLEPARSTTSCAAARTCASRTACCPPARPSSTSSPTPPSTTGSSACSAPRSGRCGRRCRFSAAEENFHAGARDGLDAQRLLAVAGRGPGRRARRPAAAADRPPGPRGVGRSTPPTATACSASSSAAA